MDRLDTAQAKAAVLTEALPYIQDFKGSVVLVKLGGSVMEFDEKLESISGDLAFLNAVGIKVVLVHGGGKAISRAIRDSGHEPAFVEGQRVTDEQTMEIVRKTLNNIVNPDIVQRLRNRGPCWYQSHRPVRLMRTDPQKLYLLRRPADRQHETRAKSAAEASYSA